MSLRCVGRRNKEEQIKVLHWAGWTSRKDTSYSSSLMLLGLRKRRMKMTVTAGSHARIRLVNSCDVVHISLVIYTSDIHMTIQSLSL